MERAESWSEETSVNHPAGQTPDNAGVWNWDRQHNQVFVSSSARGLLGYPRFCGFEDGRFWLRCMHLEDRRLFMGDVKRHVNGVWPLIQGIYRFKHADGHYTPLLITGVYMGSHEGQPPVVAGVVAPPASALPGGQRIGGIANLLGGEPSSAVVTRELKVMGRHLSEVINDLLQHQERLTEAQRRLMADEKMVAVGKLAAGVVHEIRNPLTAIRMRLHTLSRCVKGRPEESNHLRIISEEIVYLEQIIQDFLAFSRPKQPELITAAVSEIIDQTVELLEDQVSASAIRILRQDQPHLPAVKVDPDQIKQVLINLIRNALQSVESNGTITISSRTDDSLNGRRTVVIFVEDNGPGIDADNAAKIFDPFYSTRDDGTGLGLAICSRIIEQHSGSLRLEFSRPGSTVFAIRLPLE